MPAERAGYTVTMFLIDVSSSMAKTRTVELPDGPRGEKRSREVTNLEWSLQFVLLKIQEMIFNGRKTDQCGVILFGTEDTSNIINEKNGGYEHVTEYIPIGQPHNGTLRQLQELVPSNEVGDPIDALIVGIETQDKYLGNKKTWTRKIVLIADGENPIELDEWELTARKMNGLDIITTIVGIDFDDEELGYEEEDKSDIKRENEKFFHQFASELKDGVVGTCAYALQECVRPEVRITKSTMMGHVLRLGDADTRPEEAIEVLIKTSKCTALTRPPPMKKFAKRAREHKEDEDEADEMDVDEDADGGKKDEYAELGMRMDYYIHHDNKEEEKDGDSEDDDDDNDDEEEEASEKVDKEELIRGFKYGSSYAPCAEGQFERLSTRKGMDICGFFTDANIRRDWFMGEVQYVWADPTSGQQQVAFSSIVQAMLARGVVAIARWVNRDGADPKMGILIPRAFEEVDCFLWCQLPFADDVRKYTFQSLENVITVKGETLTKHPYIPTDDQLDAMDDFVDAMDLMQAGDKDENGDRLPWFDPRYSFNPAVHRLKQCLFHAAVVTDMKTNPIPPPHPEVVKYLEPPRRVLKHAQDAIEDCRKKFKVKEVPKKVAKQRKDGHVRAEDDDDEVLLLEKVGKQSTRIGSMSTSRSQKEKVAQLQTPPASKPLGASDKMDVDSETEPESDAEDETKSKAKATPSKTAKHPLPTPARSTSPESLPDPEFAQGRIIGRTWPLKDFKKNIERGDIVSKAVEDFAFMIKDIVMKPFASRRHNEMIECMRELRGTCLNEDEIDAWNAFLKDLKDSCLSKTGIHNREFWQAAKQEGRELSLISSSEASALGGESNVSESEAAKFMQD